MELPIASQSYRPPTDALVRAVERADVMLARVLADETDLGGATAFTSPARPIVHIANGAFDVQVREGDSAEALLERIAAHYADVGATCFKLHGAALQWPDDLAKALEQRGYEPVTHELYVLEAFRPPDESRLRDDVQIIPGRAAYAELREFYRASGASEYKLIGAEADQFAEAMIDRLDEPRVEMFLARIDGEPVARAAVNSVGQIGIIDDVYTRTDLRGGGIATTLMIHALEFCKRAIFEQVILETDGNEAVGRLYERLGFAKARPFVHYGMKGA